ncbi:protein kinase [Synechococcus sp. H60.2]|uniref:serine/threonine-protein kinase n=1 Tax=Synechococcus sp. H60.2 TaxID=2964518 RepID=UPI0039C35466
MFTSSDPFLDRLLAQRYRLTHLLGQGGMGRVYLAQDLLFGGVEVAIKLLSQPAMDEQARLRFEREAKACAALGQKSLHIVKVSDYGITTDGVPFYVMEYLNGQTLKDILAAGPLPLERFFRLARQIGLGLKAAHEGILLEGQRIQVIHRDLKPANVIVVADESLGELAKLVDFGIAKLLNTRESLSLTHAYLGTLAYSSPEQLEGLPLDARSDIYSFGIILYQMVSGQMPLQPTTESFPGWYQAHHKQRPLPLEELGLPAGLSDLILSCLAKDPAARPPTVANVLAELERIQAGIRGSAPVAFPSPGIRGASLRDPAPLATAGTLRLRPVTRATAAENRGSLLLFLMGGLLGWALVSWQLGRFLQRPAAPVISGSRPSPAPTELEDERPGADAQPDTAPEPLALERVNGGAAQDAGKRERDPAPELEPYSGSGPVLRAFPLQTSREVVRAALGSPSQQGRGAWPNTVYDLYRLGGMNLSLTYDESSLALQQIEATVADDVPAPQAEGLLEDMLQAPLPPQLQRELQAVRENRSERVQFRVGPWSGLVERTPQGHLYLAVWDPPPSPSPSPPTVPVAQPRPAPAGPPPGQTLQELLRRSRELRGD